MVNEETSHQHVQSITTLRSGKLVDNQVGEKKDEYTEVPETLQKDKGKQVINDTSVDPVQRHRMYPKPHSQNGSRHLDVVILRPK
jgi:hypothetical protein